MLLRLMDTRLFGLDTDEDFKMESTPQRGLQAFGRAGEVVILDTFTRRGVPYADVAALHTRGGELPGFTLGIADTVRHDSLRDVGFRLFLLSFI